MLTPLTVFVSIGAVVLAALACIRRIPEGQAYTLGRIGGHMRTIGAGTHLVLPLLERVAHRIRLLGNVVNLDSWPVAQTGHTCSGQIYYQVLDAERADAVIDHVDALVCGCLPQALAGSGDDADDDARNRGIKAALNRQLQDRGILITRVQVVEHSGA
jgi:regulator of protease activity HflC (stomatin/prohibitin superfamily)